MRVVAAVFVGALLGIIGSRILFVGSFLSLLPWGIAGLLLGYFARNKKDAILNGAVYGFVLCLIFMIAGYNGTRPLFSVLPFFILLGLFGGICGLVSELTGYGVRKLLKR